MPEANPFFQFLVHKNPDESPIAIGDSRYMKLPVLLEAPVLLHHEGVDYTLNKAYIRIHDTIGVHEHEYYFIGDLNEAESGKAFELAVAFNTEDVTTCLQILKDFTSGEVFHITGNGAYFKQLARAYGLPLIKQLRADYTETKAQYLSEIDATFAQLLAKDAASVSLDTLDALIQKAKALEFIGGEPRAYLLENYQSLLDINGFTYIVDREPIDGDGEWLVYSDDTEVPEFVWTLFCETHEKIQAKTAHNEIVSVADANSYFRRAKEALSALPENTHENIQLIHTALKDSHALCEGLFERALITENQAVYEASEMEHFAAHAKEQVLILLMKLQKLPAFKWLLSHGSFALNCIDVKLPKSDASLVPLLEYAASLQNKAFFITLLEASVSPLFLTKRGVPFACEIFQRHDELTIHLNAYLESQPADFMALFFAQLKQLIHVSLSNSTLNRDEREAMEAFLPICEVNQENLQMVRGYQLPGNELLHDTGIPLLVISQYAHIPAVRAALTDFAEAKAAYRAVLTEVTPKFKEAQYKAYGNILKLMKSCPSLLLDQPVITETVMLKHLQNETRYYKDGLTLMKAANAYGDAYQQRKQDEKSLKKKELSQFEFLYQSAYEAFHPQVVAKSDVIKSTQHAAREALRVATLQQVVTATSMGVVLLPEDNKSSTANDQRATSSCAYLG